MIFDSFGGEFPIKKFWIHLGDTSTQRTGGTSDSRAKIQRRAGASIRKNPSPQFVKPGKRSGTSTFGGVLNNEVSILQVESFHPSSWVYKAGPKKPEKHMEWHGAPQQNGLIKLVTGVMSYNPYLNGVIAPFIAGKGWPCSIPIWINWIALVTKVPCQFQLRCLLGKTLLGKRKWCQPKTETGFSKYEMYIYICIYLHTFFHCTAFEICLQLLELSVWEVNNWYEMVWNVKKWYSKMIKCLGVLSCCWWKRSCTSWGW